MNDQLTSKRNIIQTGIILFFAVGLFGSFGVLSIFKVHEDLVTGKPFLKTMFVVPIIFLPFALYSFYYLLSRFPKLTIDNAGITFTTIFKTKNYQWNDVEDIELTGKKFHKFLFGSMPIEATTIKFKDNSNLFIWADYYRNIADIRVILERVEILLKNKSKPLSSLDFDISRQTFSETDFDFSSEDEFKGNHFFTFNGLFFYGFLIFIGYMVSLKPMIFLTNYGALLSISFATLVFCGLSSYQMHYFILTSNFLIVKNSIWFWRKDIYSLENIREIVFEKPIRISRSMRVITKDFKSKLYPADSLKNKTWKKLREKIKSSQIKLRNEANV
jgi:hypothetical protein